MNLKDILAISGEGTLFKFIAQGKNAVIVENLETGRRFSAGASARVSALDEISIYTTGEDMPLGKVMDHIWEKENGGETLSHKQPDNDLKKYFAEVLPEYDRERVYNSDIRKVLHWYNILHRLKLLVREEEKPEEQEAEAAETVNEAKTGKKSGSGKETATGKKVETGKETATGKKVETGKETAAGKKVETGKEAATGKKGTGEVIPDQAEGGEKADAKTRKPAAAKGDKSKPVKK